MVIESRTIRGALIGLSLFWTVMNSLFVPSAGANDAVEVTQSAAAVTVSNAFLRIEVSLEGNRMRTTRLENRRAGQLLDLDGDDFRIELADGRTVRSSEMALTNVLQETVARQWKEGDVLPARQGPRRTLHPEPWNRISGGQRAGWRFAVRLERWPACIWRIGGVPDPRAPAAREPRS